MVGGLGSIGAATTGATVVGASDSILAFVNGPSFSGALVLFLAVVLMRFRPQGIIK
jgi:branched-subunit amino acid ABC-type transport system permease component